MLKRGGSHCLMDHHFTNEGVIAPNPFLFNAPHTIPVGLSQTQIHLLLFLVHHCAMPRIIWRNSSKSISPSPFSSTSAIA